MCLMTLVDPSEHVLFSAQSYDSRPSHADPYLSLQWRVASESIPSSRGNQTPPKSSILVVEVLSQNVSRLELQLIDALIFVEGSSEVRCQIGGSRCEVE
jgi:hypothetical protein